MIHFIASGAPRALSAIVPLQTGAIYTIPRLLGSTSTFALLDGTAATARGLSAGTNANLTLTGGNQISATAALAAGASQSAAVEERSADGSAAVSRMVTLTGVGSVVPGPGANTVPIRLANFGDSIGGGSTNYFPFVNDSPDAGPWYAVNRGRPGTYSSVSLTNFAADLAAAGSPDWAVIVAGNNDKAGGVQTISAATADGNQGKGVYNIRQMISAALGAGTKVIYTSIPYKSDGTNKSGIDWMNATIKADIESGMFATDYAAGNIKYFELRPALSDMATGNPLSADLYVDAVHPSDKGGRALAVLYRTLLTAAGIGYSAVYPYTRNASVSDAANILPASIGTVQGTPGGSGTVTGWTLVTETGNYCTASVVDPPAGIVGKAERLTITPGASSATPSYLQMASTFTSSIASRIGHRIDLFFATSGQNFEASGAKAQIKVSFGSTGGTVVYPINATGSVLGAAKLDGVIQHCVRLTIPTGATDLKIQVLSGGNPAGSGVTATIDIYDVKVIDLDT